MGDKKGEVKRYGPVKISQMEEFTPKRPREMTMNEKMVIRIGICKTNQTHVRGQNRIRVQRIGSVLG